MKILNYLANVLRGLYSSVTRFPVAVGFSCFTAILLIVVNHGQSILDKNTMDNLAKAALIAAFGIPLSLCISMIFERFTLDKYTAKAKTGAYLLEAVLLIIYYFQLPKNITMVDMTRYIAFSIALYTSFIIIPFFYKRQGIELYFIKLFLRFFVTVLFTFILYLGIVLILFTINKLFIINITGKLYLDIFIILALIIAVCFFLAGVPNKEQKLSEADFPKLFKILLLYIIMPLISVYTVILYIYFIKIIITLSWPVQLVMHLVLWYSLISTGVIFIISLLYNENNWAKKFTILYIKLILPLLLMMFISIAKRVNTYGITENRYFVIVLGLWVLGIMIYLNLSTRKRNIILVLSLSIIVFLSVIGPWSSYSVSEFSQNNRFRSILSKYSMIKDNKIVKPSREITNYDKNQISQILNYFSNNHKLSDVKYLPGNFSLSSMKDVFGFPAEVIMNGNANKYISYNTDSYVYPIDINNFNYLFDMRYFYPNAPGAKGKMSINYDTQSSILKIYYQGKEIYKRTLSDYGTLIYKKFGIGNKQFPSAANMTFLDENPEIKVKFIFTNINGYIDKATDTVKTDNLGYYLLIKIK